jgi:hypothetical protein
LKGGLCANASTIRRFACRITSASARPCALDAAGVEPIIWYGGKHIRVLDSPRGKRRNVTELFSASEWRAVQNARADVRRLLRRDNDHQINNKAKNGS